VDISFRRFADHLPLALAATAALLSTVAAAGCSQESNYCDEAACYACDGYGCRRLEPPTRAACRCDFECSAPGTECTSLGCTEMCDADADCPVSTRCRAGHCVTPSETVADAALRVHDDVRVPR
jgi:hypothetical protein